MPKLELPSEAPVPGIGQGDSRLNTGLAESSAAAGARIGQELQGYGANVNQSLSNFGAGAARTAENLGMDLAAQGQKYMSEAQQSMADTAANNAYAKASVTYNQAVQDRLSKPYDENGNPTYSTLPADIADIGNKVSAAFSGGLSPQAQAKFQDNFGHLQTNHTIKSMGVARTQQIDDSRASVSKSLTATVQNSLADSDNIDMYYAQGLQTISDAQKNGTISPEDAVLQQKQLQTNIYYGNMQQMIEKDPLTAQILLQNGSANDLRLTQAQKYTLSNQAQAALNAQARLQKQQSDAQNKVVKDQQTNNFSDLEVGVGRGTTTEKTIEQQQASGAISHMQANSLRMRLDAHNKHQDKEFQTQQDISLDISKGNVLGKYSAGDIDKNYNAELATQAAADKVNGGSGEITWEMKAKAAAARKAPVDAFNKDLKYTLEAGDTKSVMDAVNAYNYTKEKNPIAVNGTGMQGSGLNKKTIGLISTITDMQKHTNLDPDTIVNKAREQINAPVEVVRQRQANFDKDFQLKGKDLSGNKVDAAANMTHEISTIYNLKQSGPYDVVDMGVPKNTNISPETKTTVEGLLREAYQITGNKEQAEEMVRSETKGKVGTTTINGQSTFMFNPPELVLEGKASAEEINSQFQKEVAPLAEANKIPLEEIRIHNDPMSNNTQGNPSYILTDKNGVPLHDMDGKYPQGGMRWRADLSGIEKDRVDRVQQQQLDRNNQNSDIQNNLNPFGRSSAPGMLEHGNIDLNNRPVVNNPDGSYSTVRTITVEEGGKTVLLPTIINGKQVTNKEAIDHYHQTGEMMGIFKDEKSANDYDRDLHTSKGWIGKNNTWDQSMNNPNQQQQTDRSTPRGVRLNNPGNIEKSVTADGKITSYDSRFAAFSTPEHGIAAMSNLIGGSKYIGGGVDTLAKVISKYAPSNENDTGAYIANISKATGIAANEKLDWTNQEVQFKVIKSMIQLEQGEMPYSDKQIRDGISGKFDNAPLAANSSQQADPHSMMSPMAFNDFDKRNTSMSDVGDQLSQGIGASLSQYTESKAGTTYGFGSKSSASGSIDCSGWVAESTMQAMQQINAAQGTTYDLGQMTAIMQQDAAHQISSIAQLTGFLPQANVQSGSLPNGALIGVAHSNVPDWAAGRPLGVSHIGQVVEKNGQKYVSESSGARGVHLTPYAEFIQNHSNDKLYAVNPFALVSNHFVVNNGSDAGMAHTQQQINGGVPPILRN